ncbi:MAG: sulfotransferase [Halioglobus sp.]|nr:sulfotransferase [Halioglobus sp.]
MPLIHIGFPKTATTWVQKSLFLPKFGFIQGLDHAQIQGGIISPTPFIYNPELVLHRYDLNIETRTNEVPVVSSETLAGNIYCGGYNVKQNADRLHDTFPGGRVLLVTREQKSLIRALYKTLVQWGMPHSIDRFLYPLEPHRFPQFTLDYFRFEQVGRYYMNLFGEDNVLIIPYELLQREPERFARDIVEFSRTPVPFEEIYANINPARRVNTKQADQRHHVPALV